MADVWLVCVVTDNYLDRAAGYLASVRAAGSVRRACVCHGFRPPPAVPAAHPWVDFRFMPFAPSQSHGMIQHGRFLDALPDVAADDVVVLSDADVAVQRDFRPAELDRFGRYGGDTLGGGPNAGDGDTLADEGRRIGLLPQWAAAYAGRDLATVPVYNCGVLVGRASLFRRLQIEYERDCYAFYGRTAHRSRCQFHLCLAAHALGVAVDRLPYSVHTHGHFGLPAGAELRPTEGGGTELWLDDELVLFRHAV